jgi:uncharacterized Zn finger protein
MEGKNYRRRNIKEEPEEISDYIPDERQKHEEVQQIKENLLNFAKTSWGKEWIHSVLKFGRPFRMQRGIDYAKDDKRIENLTINKGQIFATVQGTAPTPYRVKISFDLIPDEGWDNIFKILGNNTINLITLLEGGLPENIISVFETLNYPLFPGAAQELNAKCSCPDKAVPCKHIAAVILYVARVLDYDPFILLELRGKTKSDVLKYLSLDQSIKDELIVQKSTHNLENGIKIEFNFNVPKISVQELSVKEIFSESESQVGFKIKKPSKTIETVENLGLPPNLENPKPFEIVLRAIYRTITSKTYNMSLKLEKNEI